MNLLGKLKNYIINIVAPDYWYLKEENEMLKNDIYNLIKKENEIEGFATRLKWSFKLNLMDIVNFGELTKSNKL